MRTKLTSSFVRKAKADPGADRTIFWDETLRGFGLMVTAAGHKSFVCQYRAQRISRRIAIKADLKLADARQEARKVIRAVAKGGDPLIERRKTEEAAANTLRSIGEEYLKREAKRLRTIGQR